MIVLVPVDLNILSILNRCALLLSLQAAFDTLTVDNADQKAQFVTQMAQAGYDAAEQKVDFASQMARAGQDAADQKVNYMAQAALDATGQQTTFDSQMAKATRDAAGMQVRRSLWIYVAVRCSHLCQSMCLSSPRCRLPLTR